MRQRVVIAMALSLEPELIIMDEPTTALDVVVQREIMQQVEALKRDFGFAVLFITHDLSLLLEFADRIAIMYAGEVVESAPAERLGSDPQHPYTQGLLRSFPPLSGPQLRLTGIPGSPPDCGILRVAAASTRGVPIARPMSSVCISGRRPSDRSCKRSLQAMRLPATSPRRTRDGSRLA
jgi:ABC-type dipeptide/oligopeptide/nickel transport system ATPase component